MRPAKVPLPKACIFCGKAGRLTREDFFPVWFRELYSSPDTLGNTISNSFSKKDLSGNWSKRMDLEEARKITRAMVLQTDETLIDPDERTLMRKDAENDADETVQLKPGPRPPNVVLVLMESMSARFLGAVGAPKSYGPNLDKLAAEGISFRRAFSSGTCSPVTGDTFIVSPSQRVTGTPASSVTYCTSSHASTASRVSMLRKSRITGCGGCTSPRVRKCHCR